MLTSDQTVFSMFEPTALAKQSLLVLESTSMPIKIDPDSMEVDF